MKIHPKDASLLLNSVDLQALPIVAQSILKMLEKGDLLALEGDLGAGKTTFVQNGLSVYGIAPETVTSPTFTLLQQYSAPNNTELFHFDMYRLNFPEEVEEVGLEWALENGITLMEWPERVQSYLPKSYLQLKILFNEEDQTRRNYILTPIGKTWHDRFERFSANLSSQLS